MKSGVRKNAWQRKAWGPVSAALLVLLVSTPTLVAETFTFSYTSEPGDFIGQGGSATWTEADGSWSASRNFDQGVSIDFDESAGPSYWGLEFAAPGNVELTAQTYLDAQRFPFQDADRPGLAVTGEGRACNTLSGEFTVTEVVYEWYGDPVRFAATFEQHCEDAEPALFGSMDYDLEYGGMALTPGNIVLSYRNRLYEYTTAGQLVQAIPILESTGSPPSATEYVRDLALGSDGRLHVFNGTFSPFLSSGDVDGATWQHNDFDGWLTFNNTTYGGLAAWGPYVFATDMGSDSGIVRFDTSQSFDALRYQEGTDYIDTNIGLDGLLYALRSNEETVDVIDPATGSLVRTFDLAADVRGIAVDANGDVFGVELGATIYRFSSTGTQLDSLVTTERFGDIDLAADGTIVAGADDSAVLLSDTALDTFTVFTVGSSFDSTFVTFATAPSDPGLIFSDGFESGDTTAWSD